MCLGDQTQGHLLASPGDTPAESIDAMYHLASNFTMMEVNFRRVSLEDTYEGWPEDRPVHHKYKLNVEKNITATGMFHVESTERELVTSQLGN